MPGVRDAARSVYDRSGVRALLPMSLKLALRRRWVRLAFRLGYPVSTPKLPRPALVRRRRPMRLTHVLVASDLNPRYLESWELIAPAWTKIAKLEPILVLVADESDVPEWLQDDGRVKHFPPIKGVHPAFQAQCIRLLYPALLDAPGAVLISDMELVPLDPTYFHRPLSRLDDRFFVSYRDVALQLRQVAIPYNAARPSTWAELFEIESVEDVRDRLADWNSKVDYRGFRGGSGWYTDQEMLYAHLIPWGRQTGRLWMLDDDYTGHRRLNRPDIEAEGGLSAGRRRAILARRYTDFNSAIPHGEHRELNDLVLELAAASLGRSSLVSRSAERARRTSASFR